MSSSTSVGCFFLDTCVILSDVLRENTSRIEKLKKDSSFHSIPCYVSNSVELESYEKVQETCSFLGNVVRETIKYSLLESRKRSNISSTAPMTSYDIKVLEDLFSFYHNAVRTTKVGLPSPVSMIEEWAISFLGEKLDKGVTIDITQFLVALVKKLLALTSSIEDLYDNLVTFQMGFVKTKTVAVDASTNNKLQAIGIHVPDCNHISSAINHQINNKEKTVFVTLDYTSILNKRHVITKQLNIECCDPLYALHHLV